MPTSLGAHNARLNYARELLTKKGRREHGRYSFEGLTLVQEALAANVPLECLFATRETYDSASVLHEAEAGGVPVYLVDDPGMRRISDVESPVGILAIAETRLVTAKSLLEADELLLGLADLNDPGNAGTLLRSAEAFGVRGVIFGSLGAEPHLPKVVRAAMGAFFRLRIAVGSPGVLQESLDGWEVTGLAVSGTPMPELSWSGRHLILVGNERRGLGAWESVCTRFGAIPMPGWMESLNASVAGSIALYEASKSKYP